MKVLITILLIAFSAQNVRSDPHASLYFKSALQGSSKSEAADLAEASRLRIVVLQLYKEGKYKEALSPAQQVVRLRESNSGADVQQLHLAISDLGEIYLALKKYEDAEVQFKRLIRVYEESDMEDRRLPFLLERMALIRHVRGRPDQAAELYERALQIREKVYGPTHIALAQSLFNLAEFYQFIGDYKKAEPLYQRAASVRTQASGLPQNVQLAEILDRHACLLRKTKRKAEAERLEEQAYGPSPQLVGKKSNDGDSNEEHGVLNGMALSLPKPSYPDDAKRSHVTGTVGVKVTIDETGKVIRACGVGPHPSLIRQSEIAAYGARFTPTLLKGVPVKVSGFITYNYFAR